MKREEIIKRAKEIFSKDRSKIKEYLCSLKFNGKEFKQWTREFKSLTKNPFRLFYGLFDDTIEGLLNKNYNSIDWNWIGDLSWYIELLLNENIKRGYDWDKNLARNCGGTARILRIWINDIIPVYTYDMYYMLYNSENKYYQFGPLVNLNSKEKKLINNIKSFFKKKKYSYVTKKIASERYKGLYSDCNSDGNARIFDCLFNDTIYYQQNIKRFNAYEIHDVFGRTINWNEYYTPSGKLKYREEYRYYDSKNVECVITDQKNRILEVKVWRDIGKFKHKLFSLNISDEFKNS